VASHARTPASVAVVRAYRRVAARVTHACAWLGQRRSWRILVATLEGWDEDRASTMAAAIAFYTVGSLPATLLLIVWIAGIAFGDDVARAALVDQIAHLMGPRAGETMGQILAAAAPSYLTPFTALIGGFMLVFGATTVFNELHSSLNVIWRSDKDARTGGVWQLLKSRLLSFSLILSIGFLLLVSLGISAATSAMAAYISELDRRLVIVVEAINTGLSLVITFVLFGLMYKILPTVHIAWRQVRLAALFTALLFTIGKYLIALYIGRSDPASVFGAAGVVIVIILWVYYSVSILLLGAEFSKAFSRITPGVPSPPKPPR
jgi:membrane protein